jgi:hypothetical protein
VKSLGDTETSSEKRSSWLNRPRQDVKLPVRRTIRREPFRHVHRDPKTIKFIQGSIHLLHINEFNHRPVGYQPSSPVADNVGIAPTKTLRRLHHYDFSAKITPCRRERLPYTRSTLALREWFKDLPLVEQHYYE